MVEDEYHTVEEDAKLFFRNCTQSPQKQLRDSCHKVLYGRVIDKCDFHISKLDHRL